ncbi:conserved hypothetical protein [Klebsiella pneumoniae]|nr:conserved hypothetical protein [Klebsiella pneumoniae]
MCLRGGRCSFGHCQAMSDFEFTDDLCADEVFVPTQVELPTIEIYATCDNVYVLAIVVMKHIATKVSITEPHPLHVIICDNGPLFIR